MGESELLEFYGTECVHCREMEPFIKQLERETGKKIQKVEVWHNDKNMQRLRSIDKDRCGGVPFFYNTKTEEYICGSTSYEVLKSWATKADTAKKNSKPKKSAKPKKAKKTAKNSLNLQ